MRMSGELLDGAGDAIAPPAHDRLGVLSATARVVQEAGLVRLDLAAIELMAARWAAHPWPRDTTFANLHFFDGTERTVNWILLLDALNFCFWSLPGQPRWQVEWQGRTLDGYNALAASLRHAMEEGRPLADAAYLAALEAADLEAILRPASGAAPIPLFDARLAHAHEVGHVLLERYDGRFTNAVGVAGRNAVVLARLLARDFPSFADIATWNRQATPFFKRAQICVADLVAAFDGQGWGDLVAVDELTAFADYKLPQLLRAAGVLVYAPELAAQVDAFALIPAGSAPEVEIRAATIWAVELLRRALAAQGVVRRASEIDYRLWAESQTATPDLRPYHRTLTIYY
jgi:hypothetical protein